MIDFSKIELEEIKDEHGKLTGLRATLSLNIEVELPERLNANEGHKEEAKKHCLFGIFQKLYGDIQDLILSESGKNLSVLRHDRVAHKCAFEAWKKVKNAVSFEKALESCQQNSSIT